MKKKIIHKIITLLLILILGISNSVFATNGIIDNNDVDVMQYVEEMKKARYIGEIDGDYTYKNCFEIQENGEIKLYNKEKRKFDISLFLPNKVDDTIYTFTVYINNEPKYIKTTFDYEVYDLQILAKKDSEIRLTFNALNTKTNLLQPSIIQVLDVA